MDVNCHSGSVEGFKNISSATFTEMESALLNKGPSFTPGWKNALNNKSLLKESQCEILHCVEQLKELNVSPAQLAEFGGGMLSIINDSLKELSLHRNSELTRAILSIQKKDGTTITKSDKTARMIAMDTSTYNTILEEATMQTGNFANCRKVLPTTRQAKFNGKLAKIAKRYEIGNDFVFNKLNKLKTSHPMPASTYVLPKDHKTGPLKGRPIVAALDGPGVHLARFLSRCLNNTLHKVPAHLVNCDSFLDKIKTLSCRENYGFASLDVVNLYGSIPKQRSSDDDFDIFDALRRFFNSYSEEDEFLRQLSVDDFLTLIDMALNNDFILYRDIEYTQTNGLSMGNPLAPQIAIIYMHFIEEEIRSREPGIVEWFRYIDDIFVVWNEQTNGERILTTANTINPHVKFTLEKPSAEGKLPFLDVAVYIKEKSFFYHLFIKKIHSGASLHWDSNCPTSQKLSILKNEFLRAKRRSRSPSDAATSYNMIKERFAANNYPTSVIRKVFYQFVHHFNPNILNHTKDTTKFLRFPFIDENFKRRAQNLLRRTGLQEHVKMWFDSGPSLRQIFRPHKEKPTCSADCEMCTWELQGRTSQCQKKNTIYKISCAYCDQIYIGETFRPTKTRLIEHTRRQDKNDAIAQHFDARHKDQTIKFKWEILHYNAKHHRKRKMLEAIEITQTPQEKLMNGCKGRELPMNINR